jgi:BTB/POZ domain
VRLIDCTMSSSNRESKEEQSAKRQKTDPSSSNDSSFEDPNADKEVEIHWSEDGKDAEEALYSDWIITVHSDDRKLTRIFHAHRFVLGAKSSYFRTLFRGNFAEKGTVTLQFPNVVVKNFHVFLEYCYDKDFFAKKEDEDYQPDISGVHTCVLFFLGEYFGTPAIEKRILGLLDSILLYEAENFYTYSKQLGLSKIRQRFVNRCSCYPETLDGDSYLANLVDVTFFLEVLEAVQSHKACHMDITFWSENVASFCEMHSSTMKEAEFHSLVDRKNLPVIHPHAALGLLKIQQKFSRSGDAMTTELTDLEQRCVPALHDLFLDTDHSRENALPDFLPPRIWKELFRFASRQARNPWNLTRPSGEVERIDDVAQVPTDNQHYTVVKLDSHLGVQLGRWCGKYVVLESLCHVKPGPGDILFSVDGVLVDGQDPYSEVKERISRILESNGKVTLGFICNTTFKEWFRANSVSDGLVHLLFL